MTSLEGHDASVRRRQWLCTFITMAGAFWLTWMVSIVIANRPYDTTWEILTGTLIVPRIHSDVLNTMVVCATGAWLAARAGTWRRDVCAASLVSLVAFVNGRLVTYADYPLLSGEPLALKDVVIRPSPMAVGEWVSWTVGLVLGLKLSRLRLPAVGVPCIAVGMMSLHSVNRVALGGTDVGLGACQVVLAFALGCVSERALLRVVQVQ